MHILANKHIFYTLFCHPVTECSVLISHTCAVLVCVFVHVWHYFTWCARKLNWVVVYYWLHLNNVLVLFCCFPMKAHLDELYWWVQIRALNKRINCSEKLEALFSFICSTISSCPHQCGCSISLSLITTPRQLPCLLTIIYFLL